MSPDSTVTAVLINGRPHEPESAAVSVFDRGFQYGDGVFETIAAIGGEARELSGHLDRLSQGARLLGIPEPDAATLAGEVQQLASEPDAGDRAVIKVLYSRGPGGRGLAPPDTPVPTRVVLRLPWPRHPESWYRAGVRTFTCRTRQVSGAALDGRIKSMNQLNHIVARLEWRDPDIAEGLLADEAGHVVEGTVTNLFAVSGGRLMTPDLTGAGLPGLTRERIMALAADRGLPVETTALSPAELAGADELFLTNSLVGIWPIREHDGRSLGAPGPITLDLKKALESLYA